SQGGLLFRAFRPVNGSANGAATVPSALELAGRALAAGADESTSAERIARLAAELTQAQSCLIWRTEDGEVETIAAVGALDDADKRGAGGGGGGGGGPP